MNYVPLWIKTDYSILSSLIKIDNLIEQAKIYNINSIGICDDNLFYVMEFYNKCKKNDIKPIVGLEINLDFKILLYAKNYNGYQNLCVIDTLKNEGKLNFDELVKYLDNIIIVLPYEYMNKKNELERFSPNVFIGYEEKNDISNIEKKVYLKRTTYINEGDDKYIPYLYKINNAENINEDNILERSIDEENKKTTINFSNLCNLELEKNSDLLPKYSNDDSFDENEYLKSLALFGLKKRFNNRVEKKYIDRLEYEFDIISSMGFCNYFLIVWDYVKYAKKNNILVGPGRGSAASSLISYCLGITDIDPIKYDLLFERFLNPNRVTMPDIDIDFDAEKRDDVIKYVIEKYGKDKVSGIITFSNLLAKQVIRDVARVLDISNYKIDDFLSKFDDKKTLREQLLISSVKKTLEQDSSLRSAFDISLHLEGLKRHTSSHAAGIVISNYSLNKYVPLLLNSDGTYLCGYTMEYIEQIGLLKMDFLALKNLSVVSKTLDKIGSLKLGDIPLDDKKTYDIFNNDLLEGVFQFESNGMKKFIKDLNPSNIDDLIAAIALFRPGPIDNIPKFILRKNKKEKIDYITSSLEEILKPTYGIIVYQEQIMQIVRLMANFSYAKSDDLRRAMSKKKENLLLSYKDEFISNSLKNGYDLDTVNKVYDMILKFANYGFNKAHSVSYAILGYKIAYLKANYPLYFMCEILNNYISAVNKTKNLIDECKKLNITIVKPSINDIDIYYKVVDDKILFPVSMIKKIGVLTAKNIILEKEEHGLYKSYLDFVKRNYKLGKDVLSKIILSGLLDEFGYNKKTMIDNLDDAICYAELCSDLDESFVAKPIINETEEYTNLELTKFELDLYGFYISNHPTNNYINDNSVTTKNIDKYFDRNVEMFLYLERKKEVTTKNNDKMMFINASDIYGSIDLTFFPNVYENYFNIIIPKVYKVTGKVEKRFSKLQLIVNSIQEV